MTSTTRTAALLAVLPLLCLTACGQSEPAAAASGGEHAGHSSSNGASPQADGHTDHAHLDIADSGVGELLGTGDGHGSRLRQVPSAGAPTLALRATADPAGGWTVELPTTGFRWAPEQVNTPAETGSGHAHLYVGDTKVARVYGRWAFLAAAAAAPGDSLSAVLYADDHTAWAVAGAPVSASVLLAGGAA